MFESFGVPATTFEIRQEECQILTIKNRLSGQTPMNLVVYIGPHQIFVVHGKGEEPDKFFIIPGENYWTPTPEVRIQDGEEARVELCEQAMA